MDQQDGSRSMSTAPPELAVVAVTYSPGRALDSFLDTLDKATTRAYEVVLADNGSTDGAPERAASRSGVTVVRTGANLGYGRAANAGVAATTAPYVLIANPDVTFEPDALDTLLAAAGRWPHAGSLGPLIRRPDGSRYPSARSLPSLGRGIGHALAGWWWPGNPWSRAYRQERAEPVEGPVGWLSGSCLLVRREAFEAVRGFDPAYFMYFEDLDLGERIGAHGWQNVYAPGAIVTHEGAHATRNHRAEMVAAHHRSAYLYLSRRYAGWRYAPLRLVLRAGLAARHALSRLLPEIGRGT
jgi:N-acetylglucosaminyl-diphospho-decaprenol L-rhamnosyltransferase